MTTHESRHAIPPEVAAVLVRLRRSIRRYVFLEGTAIVLVVLGVLFWLSLGLDALWFQLNRLELPRWFRAAFLVAGAGCVAAAFCLWIAVRMFRRFRLKALALVIERRFPEFDDRLITAVEAMDDTTGSESELTRAMLDRTVRQAADEARGIDVGAVFERRPLRRALIAAVVLVVGIGAFAATNAHAMNRWWRAYFALHEEYWDRSYHLEVFTVTPPDDRVRRLDSAHVHLHPKGGAFVPLIVVPDSQGRLRALADRQQTLRTETERLAAFAGEAAADSSDSDTSAASPAASADLAQLLADQREIVERLVAERAELRLPPGGLDDAPRAVEAIEKHDWPAALAAQKALAETLAAHAAAVEPWRIPDRVEFKYQIAGQNRTRPVNCTRVTDKTLLAQHQALAIFRHSLSELIGDLTFSVYGGDFTNREPYEVRVVEPPRIVQPTLLCDFPPTAIPPSTAPRVRNSPGIPVPVHGGQIAIPVETRFLLEGRCNKPLTAVRIEFADRTIELRSAPRTTGRVIRQPADGGPREIRELSASAAARWLTAGSDAFRIPFVLSDGATEPARERIAADLFDFGPPVVLSPGTRLRIHLTDGDEIASVQPEMLEIVGVSDEPPRMADIRLRGIGNMITRRAVIPFTGTITDDNGLAEARFEFQVDDGESGRPRVFRRPPADYPREFQLARSADEEFERFDVFPLELKEGQVLRLNVYAADADLLNGPGITRSERVPFQIVSDEDLLALLYGRELNLRLRFEQIIRELEITRDRLAQQRDVNWPELETLRARTEPTAEIETRIRALMNGWAAAADQSKHDVDKNQNESRGVEFGFREILEELENNRIEYHSANELERIHDQIVEPLEEINLRGFLEVDRAIGIVRLANDRGTDPLPGMNNSIDSLDRLIQDMNKVLETMKAFVGIHEMIQELTAIIVDGENIRGKIVEEQRRKLIEDFGIPP